MIKFSSVVVRWLINSKAILPSDKETYEYAVFCFLITFVPFIVSITIGLVLKIFLESIFFMIPFMLLRKFSGGFHLKSLTLCLLVSTIVILFFLMLIKVLIPSTLNFYILLITIFSMLSLCVFSPIDSDERKLKKKEKSIFKIVVIALNMFFLSVNIVAILNEFNNIYIPFSCGIILTAALQFPCIVDKAILRLKQKEKTGI